MLKGIQYVVETNSKAERLELIEFVCSKKLAASVTVGGDGHQLIAISTGDVWFIQSVTKEYIKSLRYHLFNSTKEFVEFYKDHNL